MAVRTPTYREPGALHRADTCASLLDAAKHGKVRLEAMARGTYPGRPFPNGVLPQLKSIGYWDAGHDQDWGLDWHRNEGIELTYLESGELAFATGDHTGTLHPGDLTITRPWQPHRVGDPAIGASRLHWMILDVGVRRPHQPWKWPSWLILDPKDLRDLTAMLRQNEQPAWKGSHEVETCFQQIGRLVKKGAHLPTASSRLALLVNELFVVLLEMLRARKVTFEESLISAERATAMFLQELEDAVEKPWTIDAMAESAGLKRTRFAHYCKKLKNMTPLRYLNHLRVEKAKRLMLEKPQANLTDIGLQCGFCNAQYFATVFKRLESVAPAQYRRGEVG